MHDRISKAAKRTALMLVVLTGFVLLSLDLELASAAHSVPVTVTITFVRDVGQGIEHPIRRPADLYAGVEIHGDTFDSFDIHVDDVRQIEPFWVFTNNVPGELASVSVSIEIWDHDECDTPFCDDTGIFESNDDKGDADPGAGRDVDLTVDLATGQWIGDANWPDNCSQGTGDDRVRVCWDISVLSASGDADGDGLLDGWEALGFDADGNGTIDVDLPSFGADPLHKDLFLEFDWMTGQEPTQGAIQAMKTAFAAAPINAGGNNNPDGLPGINLWVDTGSLATGNEDGAGANTCNDGIDNGPDGFTDAADPDCSLVGDNLGGGNSIAPSGISNLNAAFYAAKAANFDAANRRWIFRYAISAQPGAGFGGGWGEIGGNDFIEYNHDGGTIMHELGHNLNLRHGGNVNANCKPNYVSVMNYDNQFGINQAGGGSIIDYSPPRFVGGRGQAPLTNLVENNLSEQITLDGTDAINRFVFVNGNGQKVQSQLNQSVNWNGDADPPFEAGPLTVNIDTSGTTGSPSACTNGANNSTLTGFDDWTNISVPFRQFGDSANSAINPWTELEPDIAELLELQEELNTTDVEITKGDSADPAVAGEELVYTLTVTNNGDNPASEVRVVDTLPAGVSYVSDDAGCVEAPVGTLTCDLGELPAGETREVMITVLIDADFVYIAGGPTTITNNATVENLAGLDPDPSNDSASEDTLVVAEADLEIESFEAVDPPAEVLVGEQVEITLRKVITNNGPSTPMDTELTKTATAPLDSTVIPTASVASELALGLNELRVVDEVFTIECGAASQHTFMFTNEIQPLNPEDTDPDQSNNQADVNLDIECVVPVRINIKPGSDPNSIKPGKGTITVAVLTTAAVEYGLPLAFDATTIDPLSVRFGPSDVVFDETGGASERHNRGHIEDAFELDEITMDGDLDLVLHFKASATGIAAGDTEACVKGAWTDAGGNTHKFFGCDVIRTVDG